MIKAGCRCYKLEDYGRCAFSVSGPTLWNALLDYIRQADMLCEFKNVLKTFLFKHAFKHTFYKHVFDIFIFYLL